MVRTVGALTGVWWSAAVRRGVQRERVEHGREAVPQRCERRAVEAVTDARTVDLALDEADVLQHLQVLRDRRLRKRQLVDDLAAHTRRPAREHAQNGQASGMPDGLHRPGEGGERGGEEVGFGGHGARRERLGSFIGNIR